MLFFCLACGSLNKNRQKFQSTTTSKSENQLVAQERQFQWTEANDSIAQEYEINVMPKGNFKFDIASGFEGEADWLMVKARQNKNQSVKKANYSTAEIQVKSNTFKHQKKVNKTLAVNRASTKFIPLLLILFVLVVIWWFARKQLYL
ncbi:hypothetical protein [Pedobacter cryotolerans]|uniref:Uncharacterized protein n=1 Tax=Pedobacter cryotolerans TaxID=2571270 RepID=A0A4U1CAH7_9SPHI|nr:hypothetical protein [Pedobacter cryotolerans]TKC03483.1 hypothetical protein FA045_02630 [Pedobacter cryotolerans]